VEREKKKKRSWEPKTEGENDFFMTLDLNFFILGT
jgi:hypothetical protein